MIRLQRMVLLPHIAICVPVRDEDLLLPNLLSGLGRLNRPVDRITAHFYLDGCRDSSAAILARSTLGFPIEVVDGPRTDPNAGRARRAAVAMGIDAGADLILSTDADSVPAIDWVAAAVEALSVADVVAGRIERMDGEGDLTQARIESYYDRLHAYRRRVDPVPWDLGGCHHGGGANIAVSAAAYRAIGGFKPLPSGEDATLLDDASRAGLRVRRDPAMRVRTSSRRDGRAPGGLAAALRDTESAPVQWVAHPATAAWQFEAHRAARLAFAQIDLPEVRERLGDHIGLSGDHVLGVARDCPNAEAFAMRIVPAAQGSDALVALPLAELALSELESDRLEYAA